MRPKRLQSRVKSGQSRASICWYRPDAFNRRFTFKVTAPARPLAPCRRRPAGAVARRHGPASGAGPIAGGTAQGLSAGPRRPATGPASDLPADRRRLKGLSAVSLSAPCRAPKTLRRGPGCGIHCVSAPLSRPAGHARPARGLAETPGRTAAMANVSDPLHPAIRSRAAMPLFAGAHAGRPAGRPARSHPRRLARGPIAAARMRSGLYPALSKRPDERCAALGAHPTGHAKQ